MGKFKIEMGDITTYAVDGIVEKNIKHAIRHLMSASQ